MSTAVVTGATSGIGLATARALAGRGFHIVAAGRSPDRTRAAVEGIARSGGSAEPLHLDLRSLSSARAASSELAARGHAVDVMVNNAGVGMARGLTEDGFESHFGVNHLGHFLFNLLSFPTFLTGTRIVSVTSAVHSRAGGIAFDRLREPGRSLFRLDEYAVSKLANILYVAELARRHPEWRTYAVHPGLVDTKILPRTARLLRGRSMSTPEEGATTIIACATEPALATESGGYYAAGARLEPSAAARDPHLAAELWERSLAWCGLAPSPGDAAPQDGL